MPEIIIPPNRVDEIFKPNGELNHRFIRWMESVSNQTNETTGTVADIAPATFFSSQLQQLRKELNGLPKFTCDTTGFTADSTEWTADKDIA